MVILATRSTVSTHLPRALCFRDQIGYPPLLSELPQLPERNQPLDAAFRACENRKHKTKNRPFTT